MPDLDLSDAAVRTLAARVEEQQRAFGAIRYGSVFRVGAARVVLNPDAPFATANFAGTITGSPDAAEATLARLRSVWAEAELAPVILLDSPSCLPELSVVAEENDFEAVEESAVMLLADPAALVEDEPGIRTRVATERETPELLADVLADAFGYAPGVERSLAAVLGHRLDDPRVEAVVADDGGALVGAAFAFVQGPGVRHGHRCPPGGARAPARPGAGQRGRRALPAARRAAGLAGGGGRRRGRAVLVGDRVRYRLPGGHLPMA